MEKEQRKEKLIAAFNTTCAKTGYQPSTNEPAPGILHLCTWHSQRFYFAHWPVLIENYQQEPVKLRIAGSTSLARGKIVNTKFIEVFNAEMAKQGLPPAILEGGEKREIVRKRGRVPTPVEEKRQIVKGWLAVKGKQTQEMYARSNGIATSSLRNWIREYERKEW